MNAAPEVGKGAALSIVSADGATRINIDPKPDDEPEVDQSFHANLAETLPDDTLSQVATQLVTDVEADEQSRAGWLDQYEEGLRLLGLKTNSIRGDDVASSATVEGISTVVDPLLMDEVLRAQATAHGELLPADGPVKVMDDSNQQGAARDELAEALERDFNTYITQACTEYYPDTDRMLFYTVFCGSGFKKVFHCPLRRRPVSESVEAKDLIVNAGATDLANARRITNVIQMRTSMVKRMQMVGAYRDVAIGAPMQSMRPINEAMADLAGILAMSQQAQDQDHTIYEILTEWDCGEGPDGLPLPYKITIDKDSRTVLEVRRNWREGDDLYRPREMYVRYPYIDAISFYGIGLLHLLGNTSKALTGVDRMLLDAGMFSNFPGFLIADTMARQDTNELRVPPGGSAKINTGGKPIRDAVMNLPYQPPNPTLMQLNEGLRNNARGMAGSAEMPVGEGHAQVPVGTMLAMLEQATKPLSAVHKRMHMAQAKEFSLLAELLREDPEAFWNHGRRGVYAWDKETFIQALDTFELAPVSDPNSPTRTHRLLKAQAVKILQSGNPQLYDAKAVDSHILRLLGFSNPQQFFNEGPPPPNPEAMLAQAKIAEGQAKIQEQAHATQVKMAEAMLKARTDLAENHATTQMDAARLHLERERLGAETLSEAAKGLHQTAKDTLPDLKLQQRGFSPQDGF